MVVAEVPGRAAVRLFGDGRGVPWPLREKVTGVVPISASAESSAHPPRAAKAELPKRSGKPSGCRDGVASGGFTPNQYVKAYGIHALQFARCFGLPTPTMRVFPVGTSRALPPGDETTLDLEVLTGVARRARLDVYEGGATLADLALTYAVPLDAPARRRPRVISASLGVCELGLTSDPVAVEVLEYLFAAAAAGGIAWSPPLVTMAPRGAPRTASTAATPTIRLPHPG